jgi:hypothetical protein
MLTLQKSGKASDSPKTCPIFIAYRDDDGREHAEWLFEHLNGREVSLTASDASGPPVVDAFFDKNNPPTDDFLKYNQPNLERALALILVCTYGAAQRKAPHMGEDWLYREIDWWLRKRGTSPLLIRASSKSPYIPLEIQRKWPQAQWAELDLSALRAGSDEERNELLERIIGRILRGIADSRSGVVYEELQRQMQLGFRLLVATILAVGLAVVAFGTALWAYSERQLAKENEKKAVAAADLARAQARIAESRRLAALSDSVWPKRLDQAMLLALEASVADTLEARSSLQRCIDDRPELCRFLDIPEGGVTGVAFGSGGTIAAGYSRNDGSGVVLLNPKGERLRADPVEVKEGGVTSVAFGPGGTIAAGYSGVGVGGVVLLDGDPASWRAKAGQVANRNFTRGEWRQFFPDTPYRRTIRSFPWPHDLPEAERKQAEAWEKEHPMVREAS